MEDSYRQVNGTDQRQFRSTAVGVDFTDAFCRVSIDHVRVGLREAGVDEYLHPLLCDMMTDRSFRVRVGNTVSSERHTPLGAPQGSIIGPYLWLLTVNSLIVRLHDFLTNGTVLYNNAQVPVSLMLGPSPRAALRRSGPLPYWEMAFYADDGIILLTGHEVSRTRLVAAAVTEIIAQWAAAHDIAISAKSTINVFRRKGPDRAQVNAAELDEMVRPVPCGNLQIVPTENPFRFLGVWFDKTAQFKHHLQLLIEGVSSRLKTLETAAQFLSPHATRQLYQGKVLSKILYGISMVSSNQLMKIEFTRLSSLHQSGARIIISAVKSSSGDDALLYSNMLPLKDIFQMKQRELIESIRRRPDHCPVKARLFFNDDAPVPDDHRTLNNKWRTDHWIRTENALHNRQLYATEVHQPYYLPPVPDEDLKYIDNISFETPDYKRETIQEKLDYDVDKFERHSPSFCYFLDGSYSANYRRQGECAAWAYGCLAPHLDRHAPNYLQNAADSLVVTSGCIGTNRTSYTAEVSCHIFCLRDFLRHLINLEAAHRPLPDSVALFSDCLGSIQMYYKGHQRQRNPDGAIINHLLIQIAKRCKVTFVFLYSHVGFLPHDRIDEAAKRALGSPPVTPHLSFRDARRILTKPIRQMARAALLGRMNSFRQRENLNFPPNFTVSKFIFELPRHLARNVFRLWTGVCPAIGGWRHRVANDPCPYCRQPLQRDGPNYALTHLFSRCQEAYPTLVEIYGTPLPPPAMMLWNQGLIHTLIPALRDLLD